MNWGDILSAAVAAAIGLEAVAFCLAAIGLNVHFGYTGLLNFGQAAFLAVSAYGLAMGVSIFGLPFWLGILVGIGGAVGLALLLGVPTLRLRADYLAIVTIAAAEIIRLLSRSVTFREYTGGSDGLQEFAQGFLDLNPFAPGNYQLVSIGSFQIVFSHSRLWVLIVGWSVIFLCCVLVFLLMRSPWGRVLKSIREDENAARSLGKNIFSYKMQSLVIGGVIGGFGGFLYALGQTTVQPDMFASQLTFFAYTVLIIGGAARVLGPVVGTLIFWFLLLFTEGFLKGLIAADIISTDVISFTDASRIRFVLVGLGLMLLMVFRPQGIFGDKKEIAVNVR